MKNPKESMLETWTAVLVVLLSMAACRLEFGGTRTTDSALVFQLLYLAVF